jgi:UDP-N-acetylglucosamine acyltransferase
MAERPSRIHPSAVIADEAEIAGDVEIGPFVVIEGRVRIGPGCVLRPSVHLVGPLTLGRDNHVFTGAVLGERPQHLKYNGEPTGLEIGAGNTFREGVTVHRAVVAGAATRIGDDNFFMANSHVGHDTVVGNRCILANGALIGGHCHLEDGVFMSGNSAVHQFCRIGRLAMLGGCSATTRDVPPFVIQQDYDSVAGVNVVAMRRAGFTNEEITAVRQAFRVLFHEELPFGVALERIEREYGQFPAVAELAAFVRGSKRGINHMRGRLAA